jgi:hypothetical protein
VKTLDQTCRKCRAAIMLDAVGALPTEQRVAIEQHLANCVDCRAYSSKLRATTEGLRHLSARSVKPSANFRERWTTAVESANKSGSLVRAVAELIEWSRLMVLRNRRAISALAPVWVLILVFKLTAPDVGQPAPTTMARSPIEIFRAIKAGNNLQIAFDRLYREPAPTKAPAVSPRSSRTTTQPVTFRRESEINPEPIFLS